MPVIAEYPKDFQKWYHREIKPDVHPGRNATPEELKDGYKDWLDQGKPSVKIVTTTVGLTVAGIGLYEIGKWGLAIFLAPETGGLSLVAAGATP